MNLENQASSLEPSRKLKELGVPQKSLFSYVFDIIENKTFLEITTFSNRTKIASAFTVAELGEILHDYIAEIRPCNAGWETHRFNNLSGSETSYSVDKRIADSLAKMLIYLLEYNLLKVEDIKI